MARGWFLRSNTPITRPAVLQGALEERLALELEEVEHHVDQPALRALLANPLVARWTAAEPILDALLEANRQYLPRFFASSNRA